MLNRRHLRIKTLQSLYSFFYSGGTNLEYGEKELLRSIDKTKELFIWQLALAIKLVDVAAAITEIGKKKFFPTAEELNPNIRFINNKFIAGIRQNPDVIANINKYKVSWDDNTEAIRRLYLAIKDSEQYKQYLESEDTFSNDKDFIITVYTDFVFDNDFFADFYETKSIYWYTDFCFMNFVMVKFIDGYKFSEESQPLPEMIKTVAYDTEYQDDKKFIIDLFDKVVIHKERNYNYIQSKVINWEMERVSAMDTLIIEMAITEILDFPTIPVKVSMNEYIELSKIFSTPKSKFFINGILDSLVEDFNKKRLGAI